MKRLILDLATLAVVLMGNCVAADSVGIYAGGPVHTLTTESGVVPPGTSVLVRTKDAVKTGKAYRGTVYLASAAADIVDENGAVLIPRGYSLTRWMTGPRSCLNARLKKQSTNWMHVTAKHTTANA